MAVLAFAAFAALDLVACTGSKTPNVESATTLTELRIGVRQPSTLDPAMRANPSDLLVARQIYEPLVGFDPQTGALLPRLATSWQVLNGGTGFRFHLRPDARFQDGVTVTANDVAFELNRLARKDTNSSLAHLLMPVVGYDQVHGTGEATELAGVKVEDPRTLVITITQPWYEFPYVLADPSTAPIPAARFQSDPAAFLRHPTGSGPYALASGSALPGNLVLERSKHYWGPLPAVATVRFVSGGSPSAALGDLRAGRIDIGDVAPDSMSQALRDFGSRGFTPLAAEISLGFNLTDPALKDPRLRRAVSMAVDRQAIGKKVYGDVLVPADGLIPRGLPGHTELACADSCVHDPAGAKALVQQVSGTARPEIGYDYPRSGTNDAVAQELKSELDAAGITLVPRPHAPIDFLSALNTNSQQMFLLIWVADYPLADWFLAPLFSANSPDNHSGYNDPAVQSLIDAERSDGDLVPRLGLEKQIEQKVLADLPVTPVGFFRNHYAASSRVQGFYVDVLGGFDVARLSLGAAPSGS
ncbi:MAG: oligopeptide transport system substrate-binding protein [Actinomycetota bacterium]|nr:oligopeptide transport system substrate-binding protein [Actinomycetota bacterium]